MRKKSTKNLAQKKKVKAVHAKKHDAARKKVKKHKAKRQKRKVTRETTKEVPQPAHVAVEPWTSEQIGIDSKGVPGEEKPASVKEGKEPSKEKAEKSFIDRNFNTRFLYFLGICAIILLVLTLFYHSLFDIIGDKYDTKVEAIENLSEELNASMEELNETAVALTVKEAREEELSGQYVEMRDIKEQLEIDLADMTALKEQCDVDLAECELLLEQERDTTALLSAQVASLQTELAAWQYQASVYKSRAESLEDQLEACEAAQEGS